ncbi:MAG TPA: energy transducer TonB [Fimbriimonadaceae bacterium]|nr:energy transducer TonB [Fimbriimonadaceae bacterium]
MAVLHQPTSHRMTAAILGSIALNLLFWGAMAAGASHVAPIPPPRLMEVSRIVIDPVTHKIAPHIVKPAPKQVVKVPEHREAPRPVVHQQKPAPPPPVRNKVITAPPTKADSPNDNKGFTAPPDGNAPVGKPTTQDPGQIKPDPVKQPDPPVKQPDPPVKQPDPPVKQPDPPVKQPDPPAKQPDPPKPKGPTKDAEPVNQVQPEIPDSLKSEELKTFVRVKVEIAEDGTFEVILRTSSGKPDVDKIILDSLKRWRWKPALKDGQPVKSTQLFKFEIEVK